MPEGGDRVSREPDAWREAQVARLVEAEGLDREVSARRRWSTVLGVFTVWTAILVALAEVTGHGGQWPWALLGAAALTGMSTVWVTLPRRWRTRLALRRARSIVPSQKDAFDPDLIRRPY